MRVLSRGVLLVTLLLPACQRAGAGDPAAACASAKKTAREAWDAVIPAYRTKAEEAQRAASNCDGPTRDRPPCSGMMAARFAAQSVAGAKLTEVENALEAFKGKSALQIRESSRLVRDDASNEKLVRSKGASEAAYEACKEVEPL